MSRKLHLLIGITLLLFLNSFSLVAQQAGITGNVTDASTGDPLIGATVVLEGTSIGAVTDIYGDYKISNIPQGVYNVKFRYIGYKEIVNQAVELTAGETHTLKVSMEPQSIQGAEVVITAQARGQRAAINQEKASNSIVNIVAADRIREVPDANAAESIGRLPGVSLQRSGGEGSKIVIRGLSPKFSVVEVDGVRMEGTSADRSVELSGISSEMLGGIELSKSLTADKDADAIGGIVNLRTRVADEGFHFNIYAIGGYNNMNSSLSDYKVSGSVGNRFFDNRLGVLLSGGKELVNRSSDEFVGNYDKILTEEENSIRTTSSRIIENTRLRGRNDVSLVMDYKTDFLKIKFNNVYAQKADNMVSREGIYRFMQTEYEYDISERLFDNYFQMHAIHTELNFWNTLFDVGFSYSRSKSDHESDLYRFEDKDSFKDQINPSTLINKQPGDLMDEFYHDVIGMQNSIVGSNIRGDELQDDVSKTLNANWEIPYRMGDISGFVKTGVRYKKKDRSRDRTNRWTYFNGGIGLGRLKMFYDNIYPDFTTQADLGLENSVGIAGINFEDADYDSGDFLEGRYNFNWHADLDKLQEVFDYTYNFVDNHADMNLEAFHQYMGVESNESDYEIDEELSAGYLMTEINIGKSITFVPGIRYEKMNTVYSSKFVQEDIFDNYGIDRPTYPKDVSAYRENINWFPSLNMKILPTDWMAVRGAYYKSTSRPDFQLLSPSLVRDYNGDRMRAYNPYLRPAMANNFDLGISFYANKLGLFTINGFYKQIEDLVYRLPDYKPTYLQKLEEGGAPEAFTESLRAPQSLYDSLLYTPQTNIRGMPVNNYELAEYTGFEVSWQTSFWYLPGMLRGLVLDLNYSMIWSNTKLPFINTRAEVDSSGFIPVTQYVPFYDTRESRMLDQPSLLFNARIGWDYKGFSSRLSFRHQGSTITQIDPKHNLLDELTREMFRIDLNLKQNITPRLAISMDVVNMNNYIDDRVVDAAGVFYPKRSEYYGMNINLGIRYDF